MLQGGRSRTSTATPGVLGLRIKAPWIEEFPTGRLTQTEINDWGQIYSVTSPEELWNLARRERPEIPAGQELLRCSCEPQHYATFVSLHLNGARGACSSCRDRPEGAREAWVVGAHLKWNYARALYPPTSQPHPLVPSRRSRRRSPERWRLEDLPLA